MEINRNSQIGYGQPDPGDWKARIAEKRIEYTKACIGDNGQKHLDLSLNSLFELINSQEFKNLLSSSSDALSEARGAALKLKKYFCEDVENPCEVPVERKFKKYVESNPPKEKDLPEQPTLMGFSTNPYRAVTKFIAWSQDAKNKVPEALISIGSNPEITWGQYNELRARAIASQKPDKQELVETRLMTAIVPVFPCGRPLYLYQKFLASSMNSSVGDVIDDLENKQTQVYLGEYLNRDIESDHKMDEKSGQATVDEQINPLANALYLCAGALFELDQALISDKALLDTFLEEIREIRKKIQNNK